jgi:hypothetical protein
MSSTSARMNTWTTLNEQGTNKLTYWPQVNPSPLTVSLPNKSPNIGSLEIVIVNSTPLDIAVSEVEFLIPIGLDGDVLTSTTNGILTAVSCSIHWKITPPSEIIVSGKAKYRLLPNNDAGTAVTIPKGKSVSVQIYGFTTNTTPGTPTIEIIEIINSVRVTTSCSVTIFPWGFAFSDLVANVRDGGALIPVAQVDREKPVILTWQSSVVDTGSYTVYCSTNQGQKTYPVSTPGEWTTPSPLTADTVFTLVVSVKNTAGVKLYASMSLAVAVTNPDLVAKSVKAQTAEAGSATITHLDVLTTTTLKGDLTVGSSASHPKLTVYTSPLVIDAGANVNFTANSFKVGNALAIDQGGNVKLGSSTTDSLTIKSQQAGKTALTVTQTKSSTSNTPPENAIEVGSFDMESDQYIAVKVAGGSQYSAGIKLKAFTDNVGFTIAYNDASPALQILRQWDSTTPTPALEIEADTGNITIPGDLAVSGRVWFGADSGLWRYLQNNGGDNRWAYWTYGTPAPSDLRFKREVQPVTSALDKVRSLRGVTFSWNEDALQHFTRDIETTLSAGPNATESENQKVWQAERDKRRNQLSTTQVGVLAQDVEAVLPEAVTTDADGYKTVRYDNLIPLLIEAIKEQDQLAARQQAEIERLKLAVGFGESPDAPERTAAAHDQEKQPSTRETPHAR